MVKILCSTGEKDMNYIVLDLEWNMHSGHAASTGLTGEIIQIGAVMLNDCFEAVSTFECKIKPAYFTHVDRHITRLTHITDADLADAIPFPEAFEYFEEWCGECCYLTWGRADMKILRENLLYHGMSAAWLPYCYDVQAIFGHFIMRETKQYSLINAMEIFRETPKEPHDALNDALNTARICGHIDMDAALDNYAEVEERFGTESIMDDFFDNVSVSKRAASNYSEVAEFRCPYCRKSVCCDSWLPDNGKLISICRCEDGDEFFVRLKFTSRFGSYSVKRLVYDLTDRLWDRYTAIEDARLGCAAAN